MKWLLVVLLMFPKFIFAADFEMAVGIAKHQPMPNGFWYQEGLPYKLRMATPTLQLGATGKLTDHLSWHADYVYLGETHSDAIATSDENYNLVTKSCNGICAYRSRFIGNGDIHGIKLSIEPYVMWRDIRFGLEAGIFVFRSEWNVTLINRPLENGYVATGAVQVKHDARIHVKPMLGASIGYRNISIVYQYFNTESRNKTGGDDFPPISRAAHVLMMRYRF